MRVLKFGGSSLADADRFLRAADIIVNNAQQEEVAVVLSAPGKTTNKLVAVIEGALKNGEAEHQIHELENSFSELFSAIKAVLPNLQNEEFDQQVTSSMHQLREYVQGMSLLEMCPDNVNARIISKGERISIRLMKAVLEAKGQAAALIDPVKYLISSGDHLEAMFDV
jgi:aspartokinase/homoserine dehydrogenase 1